jgi:hypothetical protein
MYADLTCDRLAEILSGVPAAALRGVALLEGQKRQELSNPELVEATVELIAYTGACDAARRRLADLHPVPLTTVTHEAFCL